MAQLLGEQLDAAHEEAMAGRLRADAPFWVALQGIIVTAGNAAKLLWGSEGPEVEVERLPLRQAAGVSDDSPLKPRHIRNAFEHFDERIMSWHKKGNSNVFVSRQVSRDESWPPRESRFGRYNSETRVLAFWDQSVSIPELLAELE